jgi:hypothetical protein
MMGTVDAKGRVCCLVFHLLLLRWSESPILAIFWHFWATKMATCHEKQFFAHFFM